MEGPILLGPRGQRGPREIADLVQARVGDAGDVAACRSDPTFTRASPGLAVAEQLPQIIFTIIIIIEDTKKKR